MLENVVFEDRTKVFVSICIALHAVGRLFRTEQRILKLVEAESH